MYTSKLAGEPDKACVGFAQQETNSQQLQQRSKQQSRETNRYDKGEQNLNIYTPFFGRQAECLKSPLLASQLRHVDELIASVITSIWITLGVPTPIAEKQRLFDTYLT